MDRKDEAVGVLNDALEQGREFYCGKPHFTLVEQLMNLGAVWQSARKVDIQKILGPNHEHSSASEMLQNMALKYYDLPDLVKAQQYLRDALNMNFVICGENGVNDAKAVIYLGFGLVAQNMGNLSQAKEHYIESVKIRNKLIFLGIETNFDLFRSLFGISVICETLRQEDEALKLLQEAIEIEKAVGSNKWRTWDEVLKLNTQLELGSFAILLILLQKGLQADRDTAEEDCPPELLKFLDVLLNKHDDPFQKVGGTDSKTRKSGLKIFDLFKY